jgi:hypothetical protein
VVSRYTLSITLIISSFAHPQAYFPEAKAVLGQMYMGLKRQEKEASLNLSVNHRAEGKSANSTNRLLMPCHYAIK